MDAGLIVWIVIAAICALAFIFRAANSLSHHHSEFHLNKVIEVGSEAEEFFVPGDSIVRYNNHYYYDYDD